MNFKSITKLYIADEQLKEFTIIQVYQSPENTKEFLLSLWGRNNSIDVLYSNKADAVADMDKITTIIKQQFEEPDTSTCGDSIPKIVEFNDIFKHVCSVSLLKDIAYFKDTSAKLHQYRMIVAFSNGTSFDLVYSSEAGFKADKKMLKTYLNI